MPSALGRGFRHDRGRHGGRAHRPRLRRGRLQPAQGQRPPRRVPRRRGGALHRRGLRLGRRVREGRGQGDHPQAEGRAQGWCGTTPSPTRYPHCWRCKSPLVYRAIGSWFVSVEKIKPAMLAANEAITWMPAHLKGGRFGKWLENARDWAISRNRYWGNPIPIWRCDSCAKTECIGSRAELEARGRQEGHGPAQALHRRHHLALLLRRDDEADPRGPRLLVRVRRHALRPEPLPLREQGALRRAFPRGLHLRVHRPDPGMVLHPRGARARRCSTSRPSTTSS